MASKKRKLRNHVALVLDDSGSMASIAGKAQEVFNRMVDDHKKEAERSGQATNMSLIYFGATVTVKYAHRPVYDFNPITYYHPRQPSTALFDGVVKAVATLDEVVPLKTYDDSFLVMVVTDGDENSSSSHNVRIIADLIKNKQAEGNWTFVFYLPPGRCDAFCRRFGVPTDNAIEWEQTESSMQYMSEVTTASISGYYGARARGASAVQSFFVQPDLSKVSTTQVKRQLHDIQYKCQQYTLPKEEVIKDFVEKKTRRPYVIGTAYYQLMKTEKVQAGKGVILVEKGKPQVWAGQAARAMIGLPAGSDAKVEPGNHANYDIYVQSTSVNRKLPRGTKLIVVDTLV